MISLDTGDTRYIIKVAKELGFLRNELAYALATAYHETWHTIKPIKETQKPTETNISDNTVKARLNSAFKKGQLSWVKEDYWSGGFFGRGYVQLTHKYNYSTASTKLGADFVKNPNLVMDKRYATEILLIGMRGGWFTGKKLSDFITLKKSNYFDARAIINGDKNKVDNGVKMGDRIAGYARSFEALLKAEGYGEEENDGQIQESVVELTPVSEPEKVEGNQHEEAKNPLKSKRTWTWTGVLAGAPIAAFAGLHWAAQLALVGGIMGLAVYAIVTIPEVKKYIANLFK